jgi:hypothetical protein
MFALAKQLVKSAEGIINNVGMDDAQTLHGQGGGTSPGNGSTPSHGFRVIHVDQNSAAREAGMESLFDFIIGLNGHDLVDRGNTQQDQSLTDRPFSPNPNHTPFRSEAPPIDAFLQEIANCRGRSVSLELWSAKGRIQRTVTLAVPEVEVSLVEQQQPLKEEKKQEEVDKISNKMDQDFGIGLTLQWTPLEVADHVWHVLNVSPDSPADLAGLISHADYIVGAENGLLEAGGEGLLARVVSRMVSNFYNQHQDSSLPPPEIELYVYNHDYDTLRPVRIQPNPNWGGSGLLGCGVGYGLLHRLPIVVGRSRPSYSQHRHSSSSMYNRSGLVPPGDTLFEATIEDDETSTAQETSNLITPASLASAAPHLEPGPPPPTHRGPPKRRHHAHSVSNQNTDLTAYFAEEEQRSREIEGTRSTPVNASLPPPPKATK